MCYVHQTPCNTHIGYDAPNTWNSLIPCLVSDCQYHAGESLRFLASDCLRNGSWARSSVPGGSATVSFPLAI